MLGYFSVEWVFLATVGFAIAAGLADNVVRWINSLSISLAIALVCSLAFYALLRIGGRTPIGITYETHPAAQGHPVLSIAASIAMLALWATYILTL
jgi:hypothetical protein